MAKTRQPAIEGWFTLSDEPALLGSRCVTCGVVAFPATDRCPNPRCLGDAAERIELSRTGTIWSFTDAQYQPPAPFVPVDDPFVPFAIAAVTLESEGLVILGQLARGVGVSDVAVGDEVELVLEPHSEDETTEYVIWKWKPTGKGAGNGS